jgi:hypothetical protein
LNRRLCTKLIIGISRRKIKWFLSPSLLIWKSLDKKIILNKVRNGIKGDGTKKVYVINLWTGGVQWQGVIKDGEHLNCSELIDFIRLRRRPRLGRGGMRDSGGSDRGDESAVLRRISHGCG